MAAEAPASATSGQPSLAEEIAEVEREQRVSKALQATVEQHGITEHGIARESPKGQKPLTSASAGVSVTPKRTQKKVKTPSPVKTFPDGSTWTIEDGASSEEEEQVPEDGGGRQNDKTSQSPHGGGARASPGCAAGQLDAAEQFIRDMLYPDGKVSTPQISSPTDRSSEGSSSDEDWASKAQLEKLQCQVIELKKFVNTLTQQHAKDIDNLKLLARLSQRTSGIMRDDLNNAKLEITQTLSSHEHRLSEVENGYSSLNDWAGDIAGKVEPDELWGNLSEKEARIAELETQVESLLHAAVSPKSLYS